jgi:hypothetical protein
VKRGEWGLGKGSEAEGKEGEKDLRPSALLLLPCGHYGIYSTIYQSYTEKMNEKIWA